MRNEELVNRYESLLRSTKREGIDNLIGYIRKTDFYTAPASTRYHSCHEGGLLEHSLNVYDCLKQKATQKAWEEVFSNVGEDTIVVTALLHDLCKANMYIVEMKNKKVYSEYGKKIDSNGRFDWETVPGYTVDEKFPFGHGEKSVILSTNFIQLTAVELMAIRFHMGFTEPKEIWNTMTAAIRKYPLILAIHEADLESTYLLELEE